MIIGASWLDHIGATMKFPKRKVLFSYRGKDIALDVNSAGNTIPLVNTQAFDKVMKSSLSCYIFFVKESKEDACVLKEVVNETKEDLELSNFLREFQDVFTNDIHKELPPKRGQDDHTIDLIHGSSPPNKLPY